MDGPLGTLLVGLLNLCCLVLPESVMGRAAILNQSAKLNEWLVRGWMNC